MLERGRLALRDKPAEPFISSSPLVLCRSSDHLPEQTMSRQRRATLRAVKASCERSGGARPAAKRDDTADAVRSRGRVCSKKCFLYLAASKKVDWKQRCLLQSEVITGSADGVHDRGRIKTGLLASIVAALGVCRDGSCSRCLGAYLLQQMGARHETVTSTSSGRSAAEHSQHIWRISEQNNPNAS